MNVRPTLVWLIGAGLFAFSIYLWIPLIKIGAFEAPFDWWGVTHVYLPMFAAVLGFSIPCAALRLLWRARLRTTLAAFVCYLLIMGAWGIIDIRHLHYQIGGHSYPNGPLVDGHKYYWHVYSTWYFLPYRWIEPG